MIDYTNKTILITGITGSWGNELTKQLLEKDVKQIIGFSRGEFAQVKMQRKFNNPKLKFIIGDIRDYDAIYNACKNVDIVFHLAALKHVPICEEQPNEAIKSNIIGTQNVIKAAIKQKVNIVIEASTDKVCQANTFYGLTKGIAEMLVLQANKYQYDTKFMCVRAGNVMGSQGSVIPLWINQIQTQNLITITNREMTRFFLTIPEAIRLLLTTLESELIGGLFVMNMPSCYMLDVATVLINRYGHDTTEIIETGIRQGEKLHEALISTNEAISTYIYNENYYVYFSDFRPCALPKVTFKEFTSNTKIMNYKEIEQMLLQGGFL